jgi:hypothetical protein
MKLPDFLEFEPFNRLRTEMNAEKLGYFELFDPNYHLTGGERSELDRHGLTVNEELVSQLLDFTLVYKNTRVCLLDDQSYHIAACKSLSFMPQYRIVTSVKSIGKKLSVCRNCLQLLQYKGYDDVKARKEAYSIQVFEQFTLDDFWSQYHLYPVSEKRDMRKPIHGTSS